MRATWRLVPVATILSSLAALSLPPLAVGQIQGVCVAESTDGRSWTTGCSSGARPMTPAYDEAQSVGRQFHSAPSAREISPVAVGEPDESLDSHPNKTPPVEEAIDHAIIP